MKRRALSLILTLVLAAGFLAAPANAAYDFSANTSQYILGVLSDVTYLVNDLNGNTTETETLPAGTPFTNEVVSVDSFDDLYGLFNDPSTNSAANDDTTYNPFNYRYGAVGSTYDKDTFSYSSSAITDKTNLAMVINRSGKTSDTISVGNDIVVNGRTAQLGIRNYTSTVTLQFSDPHIIKVTDGSLLISNMASRYSQFRTDTQQLRIELAAPIYLQFCPGMQLRIELAEPIEVGKDGHLYLEPRPDMNEYIQGLNSYARDVIVAPTGKSAIVISDGGEVRVSRFDIVRSNGDTSSENVPLIEVKNGSLILSSGSPNRSVVNTDENGMPKYETAPLHESEDFVIDLDNGSSNFPAVSVSEGAEAVIEGGSITGSGETPLIEVAGGATLTVSGENTNIKTTCTSQPAIRVASGGSIVYEDDQAAIETGNENKQAVTLAANSKVRMGGVEVTVSSGTEGANYVNNNGVAVFSAGASSGDSTSMNAAVLLGDGTLIEGTKSDDPAVSTDDAGSTTVTVPSGGSVRQNGATQTLPTGGSVIRTADGKTVIKKNPVPVTGVSISKKATTILVEETESLTATVEPAEADNKTVTWSSSDKKIVAVDQSGKITGNAVGTATITVTTEDGSYTDTCTVTVSPEPVPATGITLDRAEASLYRNASPNTVTLNATVEPAESTDKVEWSSSDETVATVENGVVTAVGNGTAVITAKAGEFEAACTVSVTTYASGGGSSDPSYSPSVDAGDGGEVSTNPRTPSEGDEVTITVDPDPGYEVDEVTVTDRNGNEIDVTDNGDGTYTFEQPRGRVTVEVTFREIGAGLPFVDVPETFWAYDEIAWTYDNGYVNGVTATTFSPNASISRQQVWMILARLSGQSPANMAEARQWAIENGISDGTTPGNAVTRQQLVALLYRYATMMGYANNARADLSIYPDAGTVASYAVEPMQWSVANGIVAGTSAGTLNPTGTATRAQFAVILYRFWEQIGLPEN